ncbi:uncharacterized protein A1O9_07986 [Exophiala aquamarina CBS 119918]|uniref:Glutamine amidotransferase type-2 domain-containing protein n=1 Tax=Exophiala aquamarina CBS 119918 TaxID=1182545 RepID=A0A072PLK8_9EURO|nr:uncharacterized protein A1O9_07986 [Exophiala aquamarina CBS 119918]KEF56405.1 hypothetical protein A1O9_07986 [Exophiala aquamarina CBS 119918]
MCGIFLSVAKARPRLPDDEAVISLKARGPDSYKVFQVDLAPHDLHLTLASSVLALRGDAVQEQPLVDQATGCILCWNGEAWKIHGKSVLANDSSEVFSLLLSASTSSEHESSQNISSVLSSIDGPFAFVFYNALTSTIYYGRDKLGRRSLLIDSFSTELQSLTLASTGVVRNNPSLVEVATDAIHSISVVSGKVNQGKIPWQTSLPSLNKLPLSENAIPSTPTTTTIKQLQLNLSNALQLRVRDIPDHSHRQIGKGSAKVAVLFSGGLDCTLLARITHNILPLDETIDLINVAFENPRSMAARKGPPTAPYELCPDRITGRSSYTELTHVCPERNWRFVAVNIPYSEAMAHRSAIIDLMHPHNTEMDLSIAMALYFAARGQGQTRELIYSEPGQEMMYISTARVLLSGLGADEIFAGYSRHAVAFAREGFQGLADELELDFNRIGSRNLGRDDRMMSHWGKEVRYPYLDEEFVRFALDLPLWEKAGFRTDRLIPRHYEELQTVHRREDLEPAKMLLRLAMWDMGMKHAAIERKRAIQFGAKTAKMGTGKGRTKGTDLLDIISS